MPSARLLLLLLLLSLITLTLSVVIGSVSIELSQLAALLEGNATPLTQSLVLELRLPRTLLAFISGAMLALAGALMQVLLRNPLAEPYILGISGGAGATTLLAMMLGFSGLWLTGSAFIGALLSMLLVFGIAQGGRGWTPTRLLLTGVVIAMGWGAVISFILVIAPDQQLRGMLFWLMGDLSFGQIPYSGVIILLFALATTLPIARELNIMTRGELQAEALGVEVNRVRLRIYLISSLLAAAAVVQVGSIGFVGLVIPHILRLLGCQDHRYLLPASVLLGGTLLVIADTIARTAVSPEQLPTGIITALIGVPLFLYLLGRQHR